MVPDKPTRTDVDCNGVTKDFTIEWPFLEDSHLKVLLTLKADSTDVAELQLGVHYTVTGAGLATGGAIHTAVAYSNAYRLSVIPEIPFDQQTEYEEGADFPAKSHERALDKLTMLARQLKEALARAVRGAENAAANYQLPPPELGHVLGWLPGPILGNVVSEPVQFAADMLDTTKPTRGSGMSGHNSSLAYEAATVGGHINALETFASGENLQKQVAQAFTTTGDAPDYVLTPTPALAAYAANARYHATIHTDSGANPTMNVSATGAKALRQYDSSGALVAPPLLKAGQKLDIVADGNYWVILNPLPLSVSAVTGRLIGYRVFTSNGTYTKATNNPSFVVVEVQGGGGAGGHGGSITTACSGGHAGGYSRKKILAASLVASETVTIGAVAAGITTAGSGANGNTASFGSHCSSTGGNGGWGNTDYASRPISGAGTGIGGDINIAGQLGLYDSSSSWAATGGSSMFGQGGVGNTGNSYAAGNGVGYGSGGGGMAANNSQSSGAGAAGLVIVWEYT